MFIIEDISTKEDYKNEVRRVKVSADTWEDNKTIAKMMGKNIEAPDTITLTFNNEKNEEP